MFSSSLKTYPIPELVNNVKFSLSRNVRSNTRRSYRFTECIFYMLFRYGNTSDTLKQYGSLVKQCSTHLSSQKLRARSSMLSPAISGVRDRSGLPATLSQIMIVPIMRQQMSEVPSSDWQNGVELKESILAEKPPEPSQTLCQQPMPRPLNLRSLCIDRDCRCERWVCLL